jgi:hypothetical protein
MNLGSAEARKGIHCLFELLLGPEVGGVTAGFLPAVGGPGGIGIDLDLLKITSGRVQKQ